MDGRRASVLALALAPPALAGYLLEGTIERRLGGPRSIAAGLAAGALAMALADAGGSSADTRRQSEDAGARDGLALGLAQASALIPGVSRNGATLSAARARGFTRASAQTLSWEVGLPVILGASLLKGLRLRRAGIRRSTAPRWPPAQRRRSSRRWRARARSGAGRAMGARCGRTRSIAVCWRHW